LNRTATMISSESVAPQPGPGAGPLCLVLEFLHSPFPGGNTGAIAGGDSWREIAFKQTTAAQPGPASCITNRHVEPVWRRPVDQKHAHEKLAKRRSNSSCPDRNRCFILRISANGYWLSLSANFIN